MYKKLEELVAGMPNSDVKEIVGSKLLKYRLRVGLYRVIFEERKKEIVIIIVRVGHRKDVYARKLR